MLTLLILLLPLVYLCYSYFKVSSITRHGKPIRTAPDCLPLLGHGIQFLQARHKLFDWFVACQRQYGTETLEIQVPSLPPGIIVSSPENLEFVLKSESHITKGEFVKKRSWDLFGDGIINSSGDIWKAHRKAGLKFFSGKNLETMFENDGILQGAYDRIHAKLLKHGKDKSAVDMQQIFVDFSSFIMGHMAYDIELDAAHPFNKAFDDSSDKIGLRFQNPLYPVTELFDSTFTKALEQVHTFGMKIVNRAKARRAGEAYVSLIENEQPVFDTLIDSLLETFQDPKMVADSALNFLSAGKDTTAQSFTWTLYCILRHPNKLGPVMKEIGEKLPSTNIITSADIQPNNVPQLMALYYESLRLHPPIPFEIQSCQQDVTFPDGTFCPTKTVVVWSIWAMNRSKEIFGDDADVFRPSRWLDHDGNFVYKSAYEFAVFNGGVRTCLGKRMAEIMAMYLFIRILSDFSFEEVGSSVETPRLPQNSLTLPMAGGLSCTVNSR